MSNENQAPAPSTNAVGGQLERGVRRLAADVARCAGYGYEDDGEFREGCDDCLRRTSPPADPERVVMMEPPVLIVFECEARIAP